MDDDDLHADDIADILALVHVPIRPPRPGIPEEAIFLSGWRILMAETVCAPLRRACHAGLDRPTQRDASLAASWIQWLGTNAGGTLIHEGRRLQAAGMCGHEAFLAAWAIRNVRLAHVNNGLRSLEITAMPPGIERTLASHEPIDPPELSARDFELAEHLARWLGTEAGIAFVTEREREIEAYRSHVQSRHRAANRAGKRPPDAPGEQEVEDFIALIRGFRNRVAAA